MFGNINQKKDLIIVRDEKVKEYADYLMALVSQNNDTKEKIIGTKDGFVTASTFTPKQYKDSMAKITTNTHILFMGDFKEAMEQRRIVDLKFNKYGMHFGWLGKRAVMYVDNKLLKKKEYNEFLDYAKNYQKEFKKASVNFINTLPTALKWIGVAMPYVYPLALYGLLSAKIAHKKIKDQQYRCLTLVMYLEGLQQFMEG